MSFQQEIGARAGIERFWQFAGNDPLLLTVGRSVVLACILFENPEQYSRAIRRHGSDR